MVLAGEECGLAVDVLRAALRSFWGTAYFPQAPADTVDIH